MSWKFPFLMLQRLATWWNIPASFFQSPFAWFMWFAFLLWLLFSEYRFFACCWPLESDKLVTLYQTTRFHPRRKLSSHSPTSWNQTSHFEFFNKIFFGFFPLSISIVSFLLKIDRVISYCIQVTCEVVCSECFCMPLLREWPPFCN